MEFPTENTIILTLKRGIRDTRNEGKKDAGNEGKKDADFDFIMGDLDDFDFGEDQSATGKLSPKNWAYGFTGIYSKGYFFIHGRHVKAIEFGVEQQ